MGDLLFQVNPILVAFGAYFVFKEKITINVVIAIMLTAVGCTLLF